VTNGTPRAILPIADQVLAWVARQRALWADHLENTPELVLCAPSLDEIRRIELVALAAREAAMFFDLYGMKPSGHLCFGDCDHESEGE
jgi:hypothetical protein